MTIFSGCKAAPNSNEPGLTRLDLQIAPRQRENITFTVRPVVGIVDSGQPIKVIVTIANPGPRQVGFYESTVDRDIWLIVDDENYRRVPLTRLGAQYENRLAWPHTRHIPVTLEPGEQRTYGITVSRFYDMTLFGAYHISAQMIIHRDATDPTGPQASIRSNVAIVQVRHGEEKWLPENIPPQ